MNSRRYLCLPGILLLALAVVSGSGEASPQNVTVSDAWFRALPSNLPAAGYFTLRNNGPSKITLTGASSKACGMLMLHKSNEMGGMSSMTDVDAVDVTPGKSIRFSPGGYHLMCMSPTMSVRPGSKVEVVFDFSDGAKRQVDFAVRGPTGK